MRIKTIEDYIELIYDLQKKKKRVQTNDIASAFEINPASVTEIFKKLSVEGYIEYEKYNGAILTKKGREGLIKNPFAFKNSTGNKEAY